MITHGHNNINLSTVDSEPQAESAQKKNRRKAMLRNLLYTVAHRLPTEKHGKGGKTPKPYGGPERAGEPTTEEYRHKG